MASAPEQPAPSPLTWWQRPCHWIWQVMPYVWGTFIMGTIIATIANINTTPTDTPLSKLFVVHTVITYPLPVFSFLGGLLLLTAVSWIGSRERKANLSLSPDQQSRAIILKTLRKAYTDELAASLQGMTHIALGLHERFDLTHPARLSSWRSGQPERALPDGTMIVDAYDQAGNGLLILGEPGAGKTTLLYDLAQALLSRAEQNEQLPLPIILNLSSWAAKRLPLQEWLVEELELRYLIPRQLSQRWEQQAKLLPLLDGLDEVAASARDACIEAINTYHSQRLAPPVVCSRREEYQAMSEQFTLQSAVIVQPLTPEQVKTYLVRAGKTLSAVRKMLQTNSVLQDLLTTPLMLSVVTLAYKDKAAKDLPQLGTPEQQQQQIFERYIEHMLERRTTRGYFTSQQTRHWLTWLAQQMQQHHVTEFYLEQPTWLPTQRARQIYAQRIVQIILLPMYLVLVPYFLVLFFGLSIYLAAYLLCLPIIWRGVRRQAARSSARSQEIHPVEILTWSWKRFRLTLGYSLTFMMVIALVSGLVAWLVSIPSRLLFSMLNSSLLGVLVVTLLPWLLLVGLFVWLRRWQNRQATRSQEIRPMAVLTWSWERFRLNLRNGLILGLLSGLFFGLLVGQGGVTVLLLLYLSLFLLSFMLPIMLLSGLSNKQIDKEQRRRPNQGIRRSGWNALLSLLFSLPLSVLLGTLFSVLLGRLGFAQFIVPAVTFIVLFVMLFVVLGYGGQAYLQHYILCFLLWRSGAMPWHYVRFLEEARERILLQRVGGGYRFIHPLFLDYFASLTTTAAHEVVTTSTPSQQQDLPVSTQDGQLLTPSAVYKPTPLLPPVQLQDNSIQPASPALSVSQIAPSLPASSSIGVSVTAPSHSLRKALGDLPNQYLKVLTKPSTTAFEMEVSKARWGIVWIQLVSSPVLVGIFLMLVGLLLFFVSAVPESFATWWILPLITLLIGVGLNLALLLLSFISLGITYLIAKVFGGRGTFLSQSYTMYLFQIPTLSVSTLIILTSTILAIVEVTSWYLFIILVFLLLIVLCYNILLSIFSIMATHQLSGGRATGVILISVLVMLLMLTLVLILIFR